MHSLHRAGRFLAPVRWCSQALIARRSILVQCLNGIALTLLLAGLGLLFRVNLSVVIPLYLLLVIAFAMYGGLLQALATSAAAILCQVYFFTPPGLGFRIADPRDTVAIVVFGIVALTVSRLSAREQVAAYERHQVHLKVQRLYAVSRGALLLEMGDESAENSIERRLAELIRRHFEVEGVAIFNDRSDTIAIAGDWSKVQVAFNAALQQRSHGPLSRAAGVVGTELRSSDGASGYLAIHGEATEIALASLASLAGLTLERHRAFLREGEAEAARRAEALRSSVLDALAHAFKTPLTVIRVASSGLLETGLLDPLQTELVEMIDEQSECLNELATRLLQTARLEGANLSLQRETIDAGALLHEVVHAFRARRSGIAEESPISISISEPALSLSADREMLRSTLTELLDNAVKYSSVGGPISLAATRRSSELLFLVHSWGQVIAPADQERIFERFYRGSEHRDLAQGTGIGLSIAHHAAEAHEGRIWVTSSEWEGTTFHVSLPITQRPDGYTKKGATRGDTDLDRR